MELLAKSPPPPPPNKETDGRLLINVNERERRWRKRREKKYNFWPFSSTSRTNGVSREDNRQDLSEYNLLTFLPRFLLDQFSQPPNLYFLVISLLQQIPDFSPTGKSVIMTYAFYVEFMIDVSVADGGR